MEVCKYHEEMSNEVRETLRAIKGNPDIKNSGMEEKVNAMYEAFCSGRIIKKFIVGVFFFFVAIGGAILTYIEIMKIFKK